MEPHLQDNGSRARDTQRTQNPGAQRVPVEGHRKRTSSGLGGRVGSARGLGWGSGRHRRTEPNTVGAGPALPPTPRAARPHPRASVRGSANTRALRLSSQATGRAEPERATEEPESLPLRPGGRVAGAGPGLSAGKSERAALTYPAGSQRAVTRSKLPAPPPQPPRRAPAHFAPEADQSRLAVS